jgi:hypothetical protein
MTHLTQDQIDTELATLTDTRHSRPPHMDDIASPEAAAAYLLTTIPTDNTARVDHDPRRTAAILALRPVADGAPTQTQMNQVGEAAAAGAAVLVAASYAAGLLFGWRLGSALARLRRAAR